MDNATRILSSRQDKVYLSTQPAVGTEEEGGCGVTGFICSVPVSGKNIYQPCVQMHNRGNGKGGGVGAIGFVPDALGVSRQVLDDDYMLHIALLEESVAAELEAAFVLPFFDVDKSDRLPTLGDYRSLGLEVRPPDVQRYFVRVKASVLDTFIAENGFESMSRRAAEDEFIYRNSFNINRRYYASDGGKKAFVLSHGRDMMILKIVGYAENVVRYYRLDDFKAHLWLAHQRYPTRGRVWHPGGCHPFSVLNEMLVHNGDFANYQAIYEYLKQRNYHPLFLTDTEEAALLWDLWSRVYHYPLEYLIEALAPTSEMDFDLLPKAKQEIYRAIQRQHVGGSPDGPWFFIVGRNDVRQRQLQLIGITDTAMLRPQVFALQEGEVQVGLICSEKQAIDATLASLNLEDPRFRLVADKYWNARGGSYTDGGAFIFSLKDSADRPGEKHLTCTDKFGQMVVIAGGNGSRNPVTATGQATANVNSLPAIIWSLFGEKDNEKAADDIFNAVEAMLPEWGFTSFEEAIKAIREHALEQASSMPQAVTALTMLLDRRYPTGGIKQSIVRQMVQDNIDALLSGVPMLTEQPESRYCRIDFAAKVNLVLPRNPVQVLVVDAAGFEPEGESSDASLMVRAYQLGWRKFIVYRCRGQRFTGCGFGPHTEEVRVDVYGSPGDYLASGIDGMQIYVHGSAQDQLGQIMKDGKLVVYGDVGQTFLYGAKGGEAYIMGNTAGRPLINAVGRPRVVINGTALDYLAESFMAGDPLEGGGFVILNGIELDEAGHIAGLATPYPGSNLFSLASGGAIYVRDPQYRLVAEQLNGGEFVCLTDDDWRLIKPYLAENERLFGIRVNDLLTFNGKARRFSEVYRKVQPLKPAMSLKDGAGGQRERDFDIGFTD